jgi:putative endonuclease
MKFFVYILECADKSLYVGCTNNLEKRIKQHNTAKCGAHYTKIRRPVKLKHSEIFNNLNKARGREAEIKKWNKNKKLELIKYASDNMKNQRGTEGETRMCRD